MYPDTQEEADKIAKESSDASKKVMPHYHGDAIWYAVFFLLAV
jgi:hypothetical protein|tara:strand:- start:574 stop:702 length:129 start_codon:yes stop_codon:yes gene_type:complete